MKHVSRETWTGNCLKHVSDIISYSSSVLDFRFTNVITSESEITN